MTPFEIGLLVVSAFCTSAMTAVVGAGGGTLLLAIMLQMMAPATAIPVHGAVQVASNLTRCWLHRRDMVWPLIVRFALPLPMGIWIGLELFQGLSTQTVQILIGTVVLLSLFVRNIGRWRDKDVPLWAFWPIGFVTGILNIIVGVVAPILGVLMIRKELSKENLVGTLGLFGLLTSTAKVVGFTMIGFAFVDYVPIIAAMIPAAIIGTRLGRSILGSINERIFLWGFRLVLAALAIKLIVIDGLGLFA